MAEADSPQLAHTIAGSPLPVFFGDLRCAGGPPPPPPAAADIMEELASLSAMPKSLRMYL